MGLRKSTQPRGLGRLDAQSPQRASGRTFQARSRTLQDCNPRVPSPASAHRPSQPTRVPTSDPTRNRSHAPNPTPMRLTRLCHPGRPPLRQSKALDPRNRHSKPRISGTPHRPARLQTNFPPPANRRANHSHRTTTSTISLGKRTTLTERNDRFGPRLPPNCLAWHAICGKVFQSRETANWSNAFDGHYPSPFMSHFISKERLPDGTRSGIHRCRF